MDTKTAVTEQRSHANSASSSLTGIVKQVLSGDTIIIRGKAVNGPPPETTVTLSNIICGRVSRKPTVANPIGFPDDPFGWEAREFLRSMVIGKEVHCIIENELPSGKKYGRVYEVKNSSGQNLALALVSEGLAEVRKLNSTEKIEGFDQLLEAQNLAKINQKGKWSESHITRNVIWSVENPREFFEKYKHQPLEAIVEQVRDGTTFQMVLLPQTLKETPQTHVYITLSLSGIKAPSIRYEDGKMVAETLAPDAQFFVETRLLQRLVMVRLESILNQNFIGTVLHPNGNIAQILLREGLARCIEWNLSILSIPGAADLYKAAEKSAKEKCLRLWKDHQTTQNGDSSQVSSRVNKIVPGMKFTGTVIEVGNGDNVTVKCSDGVERKFFISSIRSPKPVAKNDVQPTRFRFYDVPHLYETREVLRRFVGCSVSVTVDYIQPKTSPTMLDRVCATIFSDETNLAVLLVSTGYATVIRYRNVNDPRSASYVELLAAEEAAISKAIGMHSKQDPPIHRIVDLSGNAAKSRQFLVFLQRSESLDGIVEFIFGASRLRIFIPRETCLITLLLSGIQCPRKGRSLPNGTTEPDMPFSSEALNYVREKCMQHNVEVKIDTMDKAGNFVGWIFLNEESNVDKMPVNGAKVGKKKKKSELNTPVKQKLNLSVLLVLQGLATVHRIPAIEKSPYYNDLLKAEDQAKLDKRGLWSSDEFIKEWKAKINNALDDDDFPVNGDNLSSENMSSLAYLDDFSNLSVDGTPANTQETKISWQAVQITGISRPPAKSEGLRFFAQHLSNAATIIHISQVLNNQSLPQYPPNYQFKKNELCAGCFSVDNCWYRARVIKCTQKSLVIQFIDFGNEETIDSGEFASRLSPLPGPLLTIQPQATEYRLAFIQLPPYQSDRDIVEQVFSDHVSNKEVRMAVQYDSIPCANEQLKPVPAVSILLPMMESNTSSEACPESDIGVILLSEGLAIVEPMKPQLLARKPKDVLQRYLNAQAQAKKDRKNIWRYGDFRVDTDQL